MSIQLNSFISDISKGIAFFANESWIYPGILIAAAVILTIYLGFFQIRRLRRMFKCYFNTESHDKAMSPLRIFLTSLSARFGIGNIIGVGVAVIVGGPGIVIWMILISLFCMSIGFIESTLSQMYHEKDNSKTHAVLYRGGTPYYLYKGLGKSFKWAAIMYVGFSILAKGIFIVSSTTNAVGYLGYFAFTKSDDFFFHPSLNNPGLSPLSSTGIPLWIFIAIYLLFIGIIIIGGVKKVISISSKVMPLTFIIFVSFVFIYILCNYNYLLPALRGIFVGFIDPKHAISGIAGATTAWTISQTIRSGATRGLFAHEAGQGSTTFISSVSKIDNPVRMGYGQALAVGVDVAVICAISGLFFTVSVIKCHDINPDFFHNVIGQNLSAEQQGVFAALSAYNFLPHIWTTWLVAHNAGWVNHIFVFIFFLAIFLCGFSIILGAIIISEYSIGFFFRKRTIEHQKLWTGLTRATIMLAIVTSPFINMLSASIFSLADLSVALCFFTNLIAIVILAPIVKRVTKNFEKQYSNKSLAFAMSKNLVIPKMRFLININRTIKYTVPTLSITKILNREYFVQKTCILDIHWIPITKDTWKYIYSYWKLEGKFNPEIDFDPIKLNIYNREYDWYGYKNSIEHPSNAQ